MCQRGTWGWLLGCFLARAQYLTCDEEKTWPRSSRLRTGIAVTGYAPNNCRREVYTMCLLIKPLKTIIYSITIHTESTYLRCPSLSIIYTRD
ncbi:hypothetical protein B0T09DRAFT_38673 [Sordaria sp. MPI-SDFR-AT-0083]|nr:hypothetical protein B0T09DRAFT_38673 [Sordaria sp. MPI-SDFR-AT-0083]